jgi:hypothetical protein
MTTYESLSLVISIAGSIGVIVSLWIWNRQTRIFNRQLMEGISQSMTGYSLEISRLFLQNPDLRPYFFEGKTIDASHPDYLRAEAVAEVILDIFWTMASQARRIQNPEFANTEASSQWAIYIGDCFASSPILTSFLTRRKEWYGQEMVNRMEQGLARARKQAA